MRNGPFYCPELDGGIVQIDLDSLTPGKVYRAIGVTLDHYRVIDDNGEPCLFPSEFFDVVEATIPPDWIVIRRGDDKEGEYYADPAEFSEPGFYEDYFERFPAAIAKFDEYLSRHPELRSGGPADERR